MTCIADEVGLWGEKGRSVMRPTRIERFMSYVEKAEGGCWLWRGFTNPDGYGRFQSHLAHRWSYETFVGPVPEGLVLDHFACDTRRCVAPTHVRPVTHRENLLRGDTRTAANLAKTKCPADHPYDEVNTLISQGSRICRECKRARQRSPENRARRRVAV